LLAQFRLALLIEEDYEGDQEDLPVDHTFTRRRGRRLYEEL
jgi:hypothetical protein